MTVVLKNLETDCYFIWLQPNTRSRRWRVGGSKKSTFFSLYLPFLHLLDECARLWAFANRGRWQQEYASMHTVTGKRDCSLWSSSLLWAARAAVKKCPATVAGSPGVARYRRWGTRLLMLFVKSSFKKKTFQWLSLNQMKKTSRKTFQSLWCMLISGVPVLGSIWVRSGETKNSIPKFMCSVFSSLPYFQACFLSEVSVVALGKRERDRERSGMIVGCG